MSMSRVIKFRAWQKYHKKMVEVTNISFDDNGEINGVATFVENQAPQHISYRGDLLGRFFLKDERGMVLELMQYTGLKDKNGVEIYEGDIVEIIHPFRQKYHLGEVFYDGYQFNVKGFWFPHYDLPNDAFSEGTGYTEIIGNIYENPEMLEAGI